MRIFSIVVACQDNSLEGWLGLIGGLNSMVGAVAGDAPVELCQVGGEKPGLEWLPGETETPLQKLNSEQTER
jgi:hypothetical protein